MAVHSPVAVFSLQTTPRGWTVNSSAELTIWRNYVSFSGFLVTVWLYFPPPLLVSWQTGLGEESGRWFAVGVLGELAVKAATGPTAAVRAGDSGRGGASAGAGAVAEWTGGQGEGGLTRIQSAALPVLEGKSGKLDTCRRIRRRSAEKSGRKRNIVESIGNCLVGQNL